MKTGRRSRAPPGSEFCFLLSVASGLLEGADDDCSDEQERREDNHDVERSSKAHRLISRYRVRE